MFLVPSRFLSAIGRFVPRAPVMYALGGVRITDLGAGKFKLAASDGKRLITVEGQGTSPGDFPAVANFGRAKNGVTEAIVPAGALKDAARTTPKRSAIPTLQNVAVTMHRAKEGERATITLATTSLDKSNVMPVLEVEGKFPDVERVQGDAFRPEPKFTICFDAKLLADSLQAIAEMTDLAGCLVRLDLRDPQTALQVSAVDSDGFEVSVLVMPVTAEIPMTPKSILCGEPNRQAKRKKEARAESPAATDTEGIEQVIPQAPTAVAPDPAEGSSASEAPRSEALSEQGPQGKSDVQAA